MIENKKKGKPSKRPPEDVLAMMYSQMTIREIAEHYGVAHSTVANWITQYRKENKMEQQKGTE